MNYQGAIEMKMKPVTLEKIAEVTGGAFFGPRFSRKDRITGVTTDSREVEPGNLFVCIKGARVDGHNFAEKAAASGAVCRLSERRLDDGCPYILVDDTLKALRDLAAYYRSLFQIPVIGIIGSVGKTTAKELTAAVLLREKCVLKTHANLNNEIGVPLTLLNLREEHEAAVVEMGISDFGEMRILAEMVRPDIVVMTSIGYCHLEKLGDLKGVLRAKSEVFEFTEPDSVAILNGDDVNLRGLDTGTNVVTYGLGENNDYRAENLESLGFKGISCDIVGPDMRIFALIPAFGSHIAYGALAAAAVGRTLGISPENILRGLADYHPVGGRANVSYTDLVTIIDDTYNANPNSMAAAVRSLSSLRAIGQAQGKRIAILGDMKELGADSAALHRSIGRLAAEVGIDLVVAIGDDAGNIADGCAEKGGNAVYLRRKEELYPYLKRLIQKGDVVLVKASHSMEFSEIVEKLKAL